MNAVLYKQHSVQLMLLFLFIFLTLNVTGQSSMYKDSIYTHQRIYIINKPSDYRRLPSTCIFINVKRNNCKLTEYIFKDTAGLSNQKIFTTRASTVSTESVKQRNWIAIHGNVLYDYFYQSHLDTPYFANNIQQHTVTTFLDVKIKDEYPLRIYFTTRFGNTNYLKNITNINFQYAPQTFINTIRERIKSYIDESLDTSFLNKYIPVIGEKTKVLAGINAWLRDPSVLQKLVEEKESEYIRQHQKHYSAPVADSISSNTIQNYYVPKDKMSAWGWLEQKLSKINEYKNTDLDSDKVSVRQKYIEQKKIADSLQQQLSKLQSEFQSKKDSLYALKTRWNSTASKLKAARDIKSVLQQNNLPDSALPKGYKTLLSVQKFSVGTSILNYSELSAKDVTISGLQIEYNPKLYYAVAGGVINYQFRNYLLPDVPGTKQYLGLVRLGKQNQDSSSIIFTYYYGRKMLYNYYVPDSVSQLTVQPPNFNLMGFSIEKRIRLNQHSFLTVEIAKSSLPYYHITTDQKQFSSILRFSDHSNEAYSIKINSFIPSTQTNLEGYFKRYGANFQSFTLISTSSAQNAFLLNASQPFFSKQLRINASIRKNDYINPFINQKYVSNIIFKSFQATLAMKRLPVVSIGFYPMTQLAKLNNTTYSENLFYTLTGNASYMYNTGHTAMNTTIIWMRFFNKPIDSGFVYFNTNNFFINHSVFFPSITLRTLISYSSNTRYDLLSGEENLQIKASKWLLCGGGIKYNKQNIIPKPQIGYAFNTTIRMGQLGNVQLRGEKTYIPGPNQQLIPNSTGRITYYRSF